MGYPITQSTSAQPLVFFMVDSADHIAGKTGLSPTVTISKNGGSFASPSGSVAEIANGWYKVAGNATDSNTLGPLLIHATGSGADPFDDCFHVVAYDPQSATRLGLTALPNVASGAAGAILTSGTGTAQLNVTSGKAPATLASTDVTGNVASNVIQWNTSNVTTPNVSGVPVVDVAYSLGLAVTNFDGTAQNGGSSTTIVLDSSTASVDDNAFLGRAITIIGGTGIGQSRKIISYTNSTKTATVFPAWTTNGTPDNTSKYLIGDTVDSTPVIRKNTAFSNFPFYLVSSTDHTSPVTGASVTAQRSIDGAAYAACSNSASEVGNGYYKINLSAADLNGSVIALRFTATSCDARVMYVLTTP